jgi:HD-like signal output (HDOD) protein
LFEECGKAVLFRHACEHYRAMLRAAGSDAELLTLEHAGFGVSHDALGAALCESWGLGAAAVASVRHHEEAQATHELPSQPARRAVCALSVLAHALTHAPQSLDAVVLAVAPAADLDVTLVLRAARQVQDQLDSATAHHRAA